MDNKNNIFSIPDSAVVRSFNKNDEMPSFRTEFMRDRDRLMYATAFRRLSGKTQIYTVGANDHKRNRLTHTLEVAQIARTIAKGLNLDEDLTEAIALGHDFGHTPFGHAGERILHEIMIPNSEFIKNSPFYDRDINEIINAFELEAPDKKEFLKYAFGFKHNIQSVRVAAILEDSYHDGQNSNIGLNLTNYTLYGMMIHSNLDYRDNVISPNYKNQFSQQIKIKDGDSDAWSLEAYVVKWADEFSQWHHDLEDAIRSDVLSSDEILSIIEKSLGSALINDDKNKLNDLKKCNEMNWYYLACLSHIVVNTLVNDFVINTQNHINTIYNELSCSDLPCGALLIDYDRYNLSLKKDEIAVPSININKKCFEENITQAIHHSREVQRMNSKGQYIIRKLFEAYISNPRQLPSGPILHLLVDSGICKTIDEAKEGGLGKARLKFDKFIENQTIFRQCLLMRRTCDHIASMTDHYAIEEYNNLYG